MSKSAIVVGGSRGLGEGVVSALAAAGVRVTALARDRNELEAVAAKTGAAMIVADAASERVAREVLAAVEPDLLVIVAGATPTLRPLHEHTWETFSKNWEVDTRIAFEWARQSLTRPLARGAHVVVFSSGAAIAGSPLSGGYAGAKKAEWFLTEYAAKESQRLNLGIRFHCVVPVLTASTQLGREAMAAYALREGVSEAAYAARFVPSLTPSIVGEAVLLLDQHGADWPEVTYRLGGGGLKAIS